MEILIEKECFYGSSKGDLQTDNKRNGEFEPKQIPKYQRDISGLEDKVISLYARGMSRMDGSGAPVAKDRKVITSSSLQNPSDPDATYRFKAGRDHKGYVGNIVETVGENGDSLFTGVGYEKTPIVTTHSARIILTAVRTMPLRRP